MNLYQRVLGRKVSVTPVSFCLGVPRFPFQETVFSV